MTRRDWYCEEVLTGKLDVKKVWEDGVNPCEIDSKPENINIEYKDIKENKGDLRIIFKHLLSILA